ncbi:MAG: AraC family transcriptional regulator [Bacteroidota bacterium]
MEPPIDIDPLDAALGALQPRGAFLFRGDFGAPWGFATAPGPATFHIVEAGRCVIAAGGHTEAVEAGDLAVTPHGMAATFADAPGRPTPAIEHLVGDVDPGRTVRLRAGGDGPRTALVCGGVAFDDAVAHPILDALPPVFVVRGAMHDGTPWLANTLQFLACESRSGRLGASTVMGHLGSIVFVQAIRAALADRPAAPGWLGALDDPYVGPALRAIQTAPERRWTVEALGREVGLGRSAFAARFRSAVGESPMQHLTRWRVHRAAQLLRGEAPLVEVAAQVGYESEAAFGRAFKRWTGRSPGAVRRAA